MSDNQLKNINDQLAKLSDAFIKLYREMHQRFDELEAKVDTKADGDRVYRALDGIANRIDTDDAERAAMARQLSRHEHWIEQLADKSRVTLDYQGQ